MYNKEDVFKSYSNFSKKYRSIIDGYIEDYYTLKRNETQFDFQKRMYSDIARYCSRKGKRVRPLLVIAAYLGYKKYFRKIDSVTQLAATLEIMHSMLLIQDDIVDKSIIRRGQKSIHVIYDGQFKHKSSSDTIGSDIAIILSDVMFSNCLEIISTSTIPIKVKNQFLYYFSQTYEKTAWGQILDILHSNNTSINHVDKNAEHISEMKTAYYTLVFPLLMGYALTGKHDKKEIEMITRFALPLGMAFQIRDDILGVFGNAEVIGKSIDSDIAESKRTILVQYTLSLLSTQQRKKFILLFLKKKKSKGDVDKIRKVIIESSALDKTMHRHEKLINQSLEGLDQLQISKRFKQILLGIVESMRSIPIQ